MEPISKKNDTFSKITMIYDSRVDRSYTIDEAVEIMNGLRHRIKAGERLCQNLRQLLSKELRLDESSRHKFELLIQDYEHF